MHAKTIVGNVTLSFFCLDGLSLDCFQKRALEM